MLVSLKLLYPRLRLALQGHSKAHEIYTHLTKEEKLFLYRAALRLGRSRVIVEVGSYLGASACFLAAAAEARKNRLFCVDTWNNDGMSEGPRDTYREFLENTRRYANIVVPLRGKSEDMARTFIDPIDLLFIDGDHAYAAISKDFDAWLPKLKKGGLLVLHDSGWADGVQRIIRERVEPARMGRSDLLPNLYAARIDTGKLT